MAACRSAPDRKTPRLKSSLRQGGEEALDGVEPGCRGRREVKGPTWIADQPLSHGGVLVGGVVVEDRVDGLSRGDLALDGVQKADEFLMPMTLHIAADHRSVEDVHGREQGRRTVPLVVMGHGSGAAFFHRQAGLVRSSAWIWLFSSTDKTTACAGGST